MGLEAFSTRLIEEALMPLVAILAGQIILQPAGDLLVLALNVAAAAALIGAAIYGLYRLFGRNAVVAAVSVAVVLVLFFFFPIGSREVTARCPDGTGCLQYEYWSPFHALLISAGIYGPLDHISVLTGIIGVPAMAGATGVTYWRTSRLGNR